MTHSRVGCFISHSLYTALYRAFEPREMLSNTCNMIQSNDIHTTDGVSKFQASIASMLVYINVNLHQPPASNLCHKQRMPLLISYKYRPWLQPIRCHLLHLAVTPTILSSFAILFSHHLQKQKQKTPMLANQETTLNLHQISLQNTFQTVVKTNKIFMLS